MSRRQARATFAPMVIVALTVVGVAVGCGQTGTSTPSAAKKTKSHSHDHDHHDDHEHEHGHEHPATLGDAVDQIGTMLASLEKAFNDDDHDKADSIVHAIGHLLDDGDKLLAKTPEAIAAKARNAWEELGDCLADVDEKLHDAADGKDAGDDKAAVKKAYEGVKARIGSAIDALRAHVKSVAPSSGK